VAGLPLSAEDIFRHQTVTGLAAAVLESVKHTGNGTAAPAGHHTSAVPGDDALAPLSLIRDSRIARSTRAGMPALPGLRIKGRGPTGTAVPDVWYAAAGSVIRLEFLSRIPR
jgi:hypothetical protein